MALKFNEVTDTLIPPGDPNVMTTTQVAEYLGVKPETVIYLAHTKKLPGKKIGNVWRFYKPMLEDFMAQK
jgi:excisionase family DNA binding protein